MNLKFPAIVLAFFPVVLHAQDAKDSVESNWSGSASGYFYFIPNQKLQPNITGILDYKSFHFETRYNYEDVNTVSLFAGYTFEKKGRLDISFTPMAGIAGGYAKGVLPAFEFNASYAGINFYSENEYMLDFDGKDDHFFYSWTQLGAGITKKLQAGFSVQSLKGYRTVTDVQRGVFAEYSAGNFIFNIHYFNPLSSYDFTVTSLTYEF